MDKKEFHALIKRCFLMGKDTVEAKQWLDKRYGDSAPGKSTIIDWYAEFKRGRTNSDDAERSGHPKSAVVPENIKKVHKIVLKDRKVKLREYSIALIRYVQLSHTFKFKTIIVQQMFLDLKNTQRRRFEIF
ncbi:hypothetical protein WN51_14188 [Melipona quadrifasciata]|uniref:Mos1 transposase HTH domain-containing protein n=1 Tax=Melipona quadrifasciata TaxID=166423 RepID=A0A0N0U5G2_9HYME|nr:hypothetical protein WN51_14188 [Melipona quadrifasciata]